MTFLRTLWLCTGRECGKFSHCVGIVKLSTGGGHAQLGSTVIGQCDGKMRDTTASVAAADPDCHFLNGSLFLKW